MKSIRPHYICIYKYEDKRHQGPPYKKENMVFKGPFTLLNFNPLKSSDRRIKKKLRKKKGPGYYEIIFYGKDGPRHIFEGEVT